MLPILDPLQEHQEFPVFLVTLIGIPGETAENGPEHQAVGYDRKNAAESAANEETHQTYDQTGSQNHRIQLIRAVTAYHKLPETHR